MDAKELQLRLKSSSHLFDFEMPQKIADAEQKLEASRAKLQALQNARIETQAC
jgi:hypothetical protein